MKKWIYDFKKIEPWPNANSQEWQNWKWQMQKSLRSQKDFSNYFQLTQKEEDGFKGLDHLFRVQTTPYYASLANPIDSEDPIRNIILPSSDELDGGAQQMLDPLGENKKRNRATQRLVHRYTDRALFLTTDMCGIYCRYCTRKHFTASDQVMASQEQLDEAVNYVKENPQIKEVIFSGGDPLTIGNSQLSKMLKAFYEIEHLELIRIGSRMATVNPFRIDDELIEIFKEYKPIYFMSHFNHPNELTMDSALALEKLVDNGVPVYNQLVLLNGINNDPALIYALSRRLLSLRVRPHYMFQADPSLGTDHLRTSIEDSLSIQKKLWGHTSGLAMPTFMVDIPEGGGKTALTPDFTVHQSTDLWSFKGWDGVEAHYINPEVIKKPIVDDSYQQEWLS